MILERIENGPFFVNTFLVGCESTRKGILVDPGHEIDRIQAAIDAAGLELLAIVNTHGHLDHVASAKHFQDNLEIPFRIHADEKIFIDSLEEACAAFGLPSIPAPRVDSWLDPAEEIEVGEIRIRLRHAPGHSPGSLMLDLGPEMIVGDVIFEGSIGRTDLPRGDMDTLLASIRREVLVRDDDVRLHPGHGPATTVGRERNFNPFLQG